jgi:hypothetical protein
VHSFPEKNYVRAPCIGCARRNTALIVPRHSVCVIGRERERERGGVGVRQRERGGVSAREREKSFINKRNFFDCAHNLNFGFKSVGHLTVLSSVLFHR